MKTMIHSLLASLLLACGTTKPTLDDDVQKLVVRSKESNAALLRGDIPSYTALLRLSDDFTLMSPFGGKPSHGTYTDAQLQAIGRFFRNGSHDQELVQAYATHDMIVLALIERSNVEVGDLPAQDWALRVTLVYRRDGTDWVLVHRHADPLVAPVSVNESAALARPDRKKGE